MNVPVVLSRLVPGPVARYFGLWCGVVCACARRPCGRYRRLLLNPFRNDVMQRFSSTTGPVRLYSARNVPIGGPLYSLELKRHRFGHVVDGGETGCGRLVEPTLPGRALFSHTTPCSRWALCPRCPMSAIRP